MNKATYLAYSNEAVYFLLIGLVIFSLLAGLIWFFQKSTEKKSFDLAPYSSLVPLHVTMLIISECTEEACYSEPLLAVSLLIVYVLCLVMATLQARKKGPLSFEALSYMSMSGGVLFSAVFSLSVFMVLPVSLVLFLLHRGLDAFSRRASVGR